MPIEDVDEENYYEKIIEMFEEWIKDASIPEGWDVDIDAKGSQSVVKEAEKRGKAGKRLDDLGFLKSQGRTANILAKLATVSKSTVERF